MGLNPAPYRPKFFRPYFYYCSLLRRSLSYSRLAFQIYDFHIFTNVYSPLHGFISNQHNDQFPVGLLAQLVERYTGIAEVMGSNHVQAWIYFRPCLFHYCSSSIHYCEDRFHIHVFICSSNIWLSYFQSRLILLLRLPLLLIMIIIIVVIRIIIMNICVFPILTSYFQPHPIL